MVKRNEEVSYTAVDGKKFETKKEAFLHERDLKTKYVYVSYTPDLDNIGKFDNNVVIKVIDGRNFIRDLVRDFCYSEFGQQLYVNDEDQLIRNWYISGVTTKDSFLNSNNKREVLVTIDLRNQADKDYEEQLLSLVELVEEDVNPEQFSDSNSKGFCENCRELVTYTTSDLNRLKVINGVSVNYTGRVAICSCCNESLFVPEVRDYNLNELSKQHDLLNG